MYCKNCGNKLNNDDKFCSNCGAPIEKDNVIIQSNINNKKSNHSIIIVIVIVVILLVGYIFLRPFKYNFASGNINDIGVKYVEDKYNDNCEYAGPYGDSITGTHQLLVKCDKLQKNIIVKIENYKHKLKRKFSDSYLTAKYERDIFHFIKEQVKNAGLGESNIYGNFSYIITNAKANITFEKFLTLNQNEYSFYIEIKKSNFLDEEQIEKLKNLLAENNLQFQSHILIIDDDNFGSYTEKRLGELLVNDEIPSYYINNINK